MGIYLVEDQTADDLWKKVGGFSGHDQGIPGNLFDMGHLGGIQQERHLVDA
jgi:hypothetical protein